MLFFVFSLAFSAYSYSCWDPMKSALGLLFSVATVSMYLSGVASYWVSYFVFLVFVSGILVVLTTMTTMSKFSLSRGDTLSYLIWFVGGMFLPSYFLYFLDTRLSEFYFLVYAYLWLFLFLLLIVALFLISMLLFIPGALRNLK